MIDQAIPASVSVGQEPDGTMVLQIAGELDAACRDAVEVPLMLAVTTVPTVAIDLGGLSFCDSGGISMFIAVHEKAEAEGTSLTFRNVGGPVRRIFDISGVDEVFGITDAIDTASPGRKA